MKKLSILQNNHWVQIAMLASAIVAGLGSWYLSENYIQRQVSDYKSEFDELTATMDVVVANRNLTKGTLIDSTSASIRQVPIAYVHKDAITPKTFMQIEGKALLYPLNSGEAILSMHVNPVEKKDLISQLEVGERAISIPVSTLDTISGFLQPGQRIDILLTLKEANQTSTLPLVSDIKVLAIGRQLEDGFEKDYVQASEITLAVSQLDASRITQALRVGALRVVLRSKDNPSIETKPYVNMDNLVDMPRPNYKSEPQKLENGVEIIQGGRRS